MRVPESFADEMEEMSSFLAITLAQVAAAVAVEAVKEQSSRKRKYCSPTDQTPSDCFEREE
jgi:hypothetical protein